MPPTITHIVASDDKEESAPNADPGDHGSPKKWWSEAEIWVAIGTIGLFFVTAALAWFTYRLWRSTSRLVIGAEDTAKRQLQAYLAVRVDPEQRIGGGFGSFGRILFTIKNVGQTPARDVEYRANFDILEWPLNDHESLLSKLIGTTGSRSVIHPDHQLDGFAFPAREFTHQEQEIAAERFGAAVRFHVFGRVNYRDMFNEPHYTTFCLTIVGGSVGRLFTYPTGDMFQIGYDDCPCNNDIDSPGSKE